MATSESEIKYAPTFGQRFRDFFSGILPRRAPRVDLTDIDNLPFPPARIADVMVETPALDKSLDSRHKGIASGTSRGIGIASSSVSTGATRVTEAAGAAGGGGGTDMGDGAVGTSGGAATIASEFGDGRARAKKPKKVRPLVMGGWRDKIEFTIWDRDDASEEMILEAVGREGFKKNKVNIVTLHNPGIRTSRIPIIAMRSPEMEKVDFSRCRLTDSAIADICLEIPRVTRELTLDFNKIQTISKLSSILFLCAVAKNPMIILASVSHFSKEYDQETLKADLQNPSKFINSNTKQTRIINFNVYLDALIENYPKSYSSITLENICFNKVEDVVKILKKAHLETIHFTGCSFNFRGAASAVSRIISGSISFKSLDIIGSNFADAEVAMITAACRASNIISNIRSARSESVADPHSSGGASRPVLVRKMETVDDFLHSEGLAIGGDRASSTRREHSAPKRAAGTSAPSSSSGCTVS